MDLFSDLQDGSGSEYFYALESAPGGITPAPAVLTLTGRQGEFFIPVTVFRAPAPAALSLVGRDFSSDLILIPAPAALSASQLAPSFLITLVVTPSVSLDYTELPNNAPTILYIQTVSPAPAALSMQSIELNVTEGGNIGFVNPGRGALTLVYPAFGLNFLDITVGSVTMTGLAPTLALERIIGLVDEDEIGVGAITVTGLAPTLALPFTWVDVDPPETTIWTTTTGVAA